MRSFARAAPGPQNAEDAPLSSARIWKPSFKDFPPRSTPTITQRSRLYRPFHGEQCKWLARNQRRAMAPKISPHLLQSGLGRRFQPAGKIELASLATPQPKSANAPPHSEVVAAEPLKVVDIPVAVLLPVVEQTRVQKRTLSPVTS